MQRNKTLFKKIFQRKKVLGLSISIFLFFIFLFSTITSFIFLEISEVDKNPIDMDSVDRSIWHGEYYDEGVIEKHVEGYRKYIKDKFKLVNSDFDQYRVPSFTKIEINTTDAYDFNEETSTIYARGFVTASWDQNSVQNYQEKSKYNSLHVQTSDDVLSTSYLNFYDSENQIYRNILLDNAGQNKISKYEFSGRFRLERDLRKFPFDKLVFKIALKSLMDARDVNFVNSYNDSFTDDKYRFEAFINRKNYCYEEDETDEYEKELAWGCNYNYLKPIYYSEIKHSELDEFESQIPNELGYVPLIKNTIHFDRAYSSSFFRYILPLLVGITVLFLTDYLSDEFIEFKLATPPTVLLTFIFMQNGYQAEIPQISYITFIDKLYYLSYFAAILQLSSTLIGINSRNRFTRKLKKKSYLDLRIIFRFIFLISTIFLPFVMYFTS